MLLIVPLLMANYRLYAPMGLGRLYGEVQPWQVSLVRNIKGQLCSCVVEESHCAQFLCFVNLPDIVA